MAKRYRTKRIEMAGETIDVSFPVHDFQRFTERTATMSSASTEDIENSLLAVLGKHSVAEALMLDVPLGASFVIADLIDQRVFAGTISGNGRAMHISTVLPPVRKFWGVNPDDICLSVRTGNIVRFEKPGEDGGVFRLKPKKN